MGEEKERRGRDCQGGECIHAGQFMSSRVHDTGEESSDEDAEIDVVTSDTETDLLKRRGAGEKAQEKPPKPNIASEERPVTFYKFGPKQTRSIAIDVSLGKLNKCINFAYKRLTTPRWKYFHGLKLSWKERLRLNNVIWRSWHMEFVGKQNPKYCCYSVPVEETHHHHPEAAVLEGMYWKRRLDAVCAQYKRWRMHKPPVGGGRGAARVGRHRRHASGSGLRARPSVDGSGMDSTGASGSQLTESDIGVFVPHPQPSRSSAGPMPVSTIGSSADTDSILGLGGQFFDKDDLDNYFTDRLFDSLNQTSYMFPDPKELHVGAGGNSETSFLARKTDEDEYQPAGEDDDPLFQDEYPLKSLELPPIPFKETSSSLASPPPATLSSYSSKDLEDAALLLHPHSQYSSSAPCQSRPSAVPPAYTEASLPLDTGMLHMGPPNATVAATSHHYPTPSKGSLKAYPNAVPPIQDHPKVRAKRAKQRAKAQELEQQQASRASVVAGAQQQASRASVVAMQPHLLPASTADPTPLDMGRMTLSSAFTPVPQMLPYRPSGVPPPNSLCPPPPSGAISPPQCRGQPAPLPPPPPTFASFLPQHSPAPLTQPVLLVKPTQSLPTIPTYPYAPNPLQLSPLPSPNSTASSTQAASPVTSPLNPPQSLQPPLLPNTPIKKEPPEPALISSAGAASTSRLAKEEGGAQVRKRGSAARAGAKRAAADSTMDPNERKRMLHLHAEQSRRSALKSGFDQLEELLPNLSPGAKNTNAAILARASEHIRDLRERVESERVELTRVEERVAAMQERIRLYQTDMPSGAGGASGGGSSLVGLAAAFVRRRTKEDWKFALLWRLCAKLWRSFVADVDGKTREELAAAARDWASKHCTILELRPGPPLSEMSSLLVELATESPGVLSNPSALPAAVVALAAKTYP